MTGFNPRTHTGCDLPNLILLIGSGWFQSTHPHGVRHSRTPCVLSMYYVSIHAPTRGATGHEKGGDPLYGSFNPRTHTGCDAHISISLSYHASFNPRTHTGCDDLLITKFDHNESFNPRTHTGCDSCKTCNKSSRKRFQSTHPHGVRLDSRFCEVEQDGFQSTHPHGVRLYINNIRIWKR